MASDRAAIDRGSRNMNRLAATAVSVLALACIAAVPDAACAQDYPSHPIKLVLPQPPGGAIDLIARTLGERLSEQMSQPVIVENRPGANGGLAAGDVAAFDPRWLYAVYGRRHQSGEARQSRRPDRRLWQAARFAVTSAILATKRVHVRNFRRRYSPRHESWDCLAISPHEVRALESKLYS